MSPAAATTGVTKVHVRRIKTTTLTAPFAPPTSCGSSFLPVVTSTKEPYSGLTSRRTTTQWEMHRSSEAGCQPSGAADPEERSESYALAVCPSGWTAYNLGASTTYGMKDKNVEFTATCCASGFISREYIGTEPAIPSGLWCVQPLNISVTETVTAGHTIVTSAVRLHEPWPITWKASDISTLTPQPPSLTPTCTNRQLRSWVPGQSSPLPVVDSDHCRTASKPEGAYGWSKGIITLAAVIPCTVVGIALLCCACCFWRRRQRRRKRKMDEMRTHHYELDHTVGHPVDGNQGQNDGTVDLHPRGTAGHQGLVSAEHDVNAATTETPSEPPPTYTR